MLIDIAKQQLRKAGWYEGRKIDLTKYEEAYAKSAVNCFLPQENFLKSMEICIFMINMKHLIWKTVIA